MKTELKEKQFYEIIYVSFLILTTFRYFLTTTALNTEVLKNPLLFISYILGGFVLIKIVDDWKKFWGWREILMAIITVGLLVASNLFMQHEYVWEYIVLIAGARGVDFKKILKSWLITVSILFALTVIGSMVGLIENFVYYRDDISTHARYAMGFIYCTDYCAYLFFIAAAWVYLREERLTYLEIVGIVALAILAYFVSDARNTTICLAMLAVCLIFGKIKKINSGKLKIGEVVTFFISTLSVWISFVVIGLSAIHEEGNTFCIFINKIFGSRIRTNSDAFSRYLPTLLGQPVAQKGLGGESYTGIPDNYFFIDTSYVSILLRMGILAFIAILIMWCMVSYREAKKRSYSGIIVVSLIAVHSMIEHHLFHISYNPFFILLFAGGSLEYIKFSGVFGKIKQKLVKNGIDGRITKNILSILVFSVVVEILAFNMQSLTSAFNKGKALPDYSLMTANMYETGRGTYASDGGISVIAVQGVQDKISSFYIDLTVYTKDDFKVHNDVDYKVEILKLNAQATDIGEGQSAYDLLETLEVKSGVPSSGYVEFDSPLENTSLIIFIYMDDMYEYMIKDLYFDYAKPFNVNFVRVLIMFVVITIIYYYGLEKRKVEEITETTKTVHKSTDEFTSTGALRTAEHEHMRAVYEDKSIIYLGLKRFFDILLSGIAIVCLSPIFIITAIAIKVEDNGPVFFVQPRAGKDMKTIRMWKFRSMYVNADDKLKELLKENEQTGHAFKIKNDPRITKVGKFIRRYSIDELPQLFNIFMGDMSIVGPRPILVFQMEECDDYDKQRLIVRPGLTCIWQVSGRANIKWDKWIELDLEYIDKMSLMTDIKLILKTIPVIFTGDGAF